MDEVGQTLPIRSRLWTEELGDFQSHAEYPAASVVQVGVCKIELFFPFSHSLKEKRQVLLKLKQKLRDRFKIPVNEVGWQDKWQRTTLAYTVLGDERGAVQAELDKVLRALEEHVTGEILDVQMEILSF